MLLLVIFLYLAHIILWSSLIKLLLIYIHKPLENIFLKLYLFLFLIEYDITEHGYKSSYIQGRPLLWARGIVPATETADLSYLTRWGNKPAIGAVGFSTHYAFFRSGRFSLTCYYPAEYAKYKHYLLFLLLSYFLFFKQMAYEP